MDTHPRREYLETQTSYKMIKGIYRLFDDYYVEPILSLIPYVGDVAMTVLIIPYLYVSIFKVKSFRLTLAILFNILLDCIIGLVPLVGSVGDFFFKAHKKNYAMIVGYVEGQEDVVRSVNKRAAVTAAALVLFIAIIALQIYLISLLGNWIFG